jgi:hypothetical protein
LKTLPSCDLMVAIRAGCQGAFPGTFNVHNARKAVKKARKQRKQLARLTVAPASGRPLKLLFRRDSAGEWAVAPFSAT